jgi:hypothetical protein
MVRAKLGPDLFESFPIVGGDDYQRALSRVGFCAIATDAAGTAGEKNNLIFQQ